MAILHSPDGKIVGITCEPMAFKAIKGAASYQSWTGLTELFQKKPDGMSLGVEAEIARLIR